MKRVTQDERPIHAHICLSEDPGNSAPGSKLFRTSPALVFLKIGRGSTC